MTREKYELAIGRIDAADFNATTKTFEVVAQYVESLEQRIAELETPKTCDGCMYDVVGGYDCTHWSSKQEDCCIRFNNPTDYYEPKEQK